MPVPMLKTQPLHSVFAVLIGAAIPSLVLGRAVFAVVVGLSLLALLSSDLRSQAWREVLAASKTTVGFAVIATLLLWVLSALGSNFIIRSLEAVLRTGAFVCIAVMVFGALRPEPRLQNLCLKSLAVVSLIGAGIALLATMVMPELYWCLRLEGWSSVPINSAYKGYAAISVLLVPILIWIFLAFRNVWQLVSLMAAACFLLLVWETYNRAAIAGFIGIVFALALTVFVNDARRLVAILCVGLTSLLTASVLIWLKVTRNHTIDIAPETYWYFPVWLIDFQRQTIWDHAYQVFETAPWFGVGANTINFTPGANQPLPGNESLHIIPAHPHNWTIEIMAETGGLGLFALLVTLAVIAVSLILKYRKTGTPRYLMVVAMLAGYWVSGLFNFSYWSAWWQVSFVLAVAVAASLSKTGAR